MFKLCKKIISWISKHRYIFCMYPKNWNDEKELQYQKWASTQSPIKTFYSKKGEHK